MSDHDAFINGHLLRSQRETRGWTMTDMAMRSCLSIKQIRQLEEGGSESFYSDAVKLTAAKKVASLLGLSVEQAVGQPERSVSLSAETPPMQSITPTRDVDSEAEAQARDVPAKHVISPIGLSQAEPSQAKLEHAESMPTDVQLTSDSNQSAKASQMSLWVMAVLFAVALLVAAWMNPSAEPVVTEAAPPLQTLPADMSEPASSAAGVASDAAASSSAAVASQARVTGAQVAASSAAAASSPTMRAPEAAETASR
jgi:transcriptional regulator with XRE-family HTH domain